VAAKLTAGVHLPLGMFNLTPPPTPMIFTPFYPGYGSWMYTRTAHLPEHKKMIRDWADYLDKIKVGAEAILLRQPA